jgi:1-acyl-sn-glycerol-3-phosphate acyltransferase
MGERWSLIVFPEGTRGTGAEVSPFKSGLYHLCCRVPSVELVPVFLENLNRILPKGDSVPVPMLCRVVFGEPMRLEEGEGKEAFLARAREAVVRLRAVGASS